MTTTANRPFALTVAPEAVFVPEYPDVAVGYRAFALVQSRCTRGIEWRPLTDRVVFARDADRVELDYRVDCDAVEGEYGRIPLGTMVWDYALGQVRHATDLTSSGRRSRI